MLSAKSTCQLDNVVDCLSRVPNCSSFLNSQIFENNDTFNTVKGYMILCKDEVDVDINFDAFPNTLEELFKIGGDNVLFNLDVDYFDSEGFPALFQCVMKYTNKPGAFVDCINGGPNM
ncbi:hypothetical protein Pmani_031980 [Petrolisthes manimaculis]|uniref:Uncharacterized protein n=1 Tax=Petrolisthes manimaculis TaxID=1843537 RepID=A0AAE1TU86_9EUCA|nr:hypothetical protein Pmani_031980 [Petrolisthes manimaculis]